MSRRFRGGAGTVSANSLPVSLRVAFNVMSGSRCFPLAALEGGPISHYKLKVKRGASLGLNRFPRPRITSKSNTPYPSPLCALADDRRGDACVAPTPQRTACIPTRNPSARVSRKFWISTRAREPSSRTRRESLKKQGGHGIARIPPQRDSRRSPRVGEGYSQGCSGISVPSSGHAPGCPPLWRARCRLA